MKRHFPFTALEPANVGKCPIEQVTSPTSRRPLCPEDLVKLRSEAACRQAAKLSLEGKEYVVRDGDVIHFKFNV